MMVLLKNKLFYVFSIISIAIIFSEATKTNTMCNGYTTKACNGVMSRIRIGRSIFTEKKSLLSENSTDAKDVGTVNISVVGGTMSAPKEYPHMALIGFGKYSEVRWLCGGSLISENFVLTAAHCAVSTAGNPTWIRLGELNLEVTDDDARVIDYPITQIIVHPGYHPPVSYNDIALLKFRGLTAFNNYIRPICLNIFQDIPIQKVTAAGWGSTGYGERGSSELQSVELDIQRNELCDALYTGNRLPNGFNQSTMLCIGYTPGGKDTCQGDSGGPLLITNHNAGCKDVSIYKQIGIVSFGNNCALPDTPGVYTKVSYFIPWIESIVWK